MAAAADVEAGLVGKVGTAPIVAHRMVGERSGDVDAREYVARRGDRLAATDRGVGERLEMRGFGGDRVDARLGDAARGFVEVGRVEAHDTRERDRTRTRPNSST